MAGVLGLGVLMVRAPVHPGSGRLSIFSLFPPDYFLKQPLQEELITALTTIQSGSRDEGNDTREEEDFSSDGLGMAAATKPEQEYDAGLIPDRVEDLRNVSGMKMQPLEAAKFKLLSGGDARMTNTGALFDGEIDMPEYVGGGSLNIHYPEGARLRSITGRTVLNFRIEADGHVSTVNVIVSSHPILDSVAVNAITTCRFEPARVRGEAIAFDVNLPVNFLLW